MVPKGRHRGSYSRAVPPRYGWEGVPVIVANMDTVGTFEMATKLAEVPWAPPCALSREIIARAPAVAVFHRVVLALLRWAVHVIHPLRASHTQLSLPLTVQDACRRPQALHRRGVGRLLQRQARSRAPRRHERRNLRSGFRETQGNRTSRRAIFAFCRAL